MENLGRTTKFYRLKDRAIAAVLEGPNLDKAARKIGITEKTLIDWMKRADFQDAFKKARGQVLEVTLTRLNRASGKAIKALMRNLTCGSPADEIRAAVAILNQGFRGVELVDHAERLKDLERQLEGSENENAISSFEARKTG